MKNRCNGILGFLFGHNFESKITKYIPNDCLTFKGFSSFQVERVSIANSKKEYKIICTRCGEEK